MSALEASTPGNERAKERDESSGKSRREERLKYETLFSLVEIHIPQKECGFARRLNLIAKRKWIAGNVDFGFELSRS